MQAMSKRGTVINGSPITCNQQILVFILAHAIGIPRHHMRITDIPTLVYEHPASKKSPGKEVHMTLLNVTIRTLIIWPVFSVLLLGQTVPRQNPDHSCKEFVQEFYNWYAAINLRNTRGRTWEIALKRKPQVFSHKLFEQITEDSKAQEKADGDIVGLDFDPFLACQDCRERYTVDKVTSKDAKCRAEVYGVSSGKKSKDPDVMPELRMENGHWVFVDFLYPNPSRPEFRSLSSQLEYLRKFGEKPAK